MIPPSATPPLRNLDTRVADSPLVGLRFHVDARTADLDAAASDLEARIGETAALRADLLVRLQRNAPARTQALDLLPELAGRSAELIAGVAATFSEGLEVGAALSRLEERDAGLRSLLCDVTAEQRTLRSVSAELARVQPGEAVDPGGHSVRYSQAARQMLRTAETEHAKTVRRILDGPMQRLADAGFEAELIARSLAGRSAAAEGSGTGCLAAVVDASALLEEVIARLLPLEAERGLVPALRALQVAWRDRGDVHIQIIGRQRRLPELAEISVYRIFEEAIDNALRHSRGRRVDALLSFHADRLVLLVKDDGDGFDVRATKARLGRTRGLGLIEMRERAAMIGGRLQVHSIPGMGSEVRVTIAAAGHATT